VGESGPGQRRQLVDGRERFVFWAAPHVALSLEGDVGKV
jgi:hypothetical protein